MENITVGPTGGGATLTGSRRADGQPEGPNPTRASAPGSIVSAHGMSTSEGIDDPKMQDHAQKAAAGGRSLPPSQDMEPTQA